MIKSFIVALSFISVLTFGSGAVISASPSSISNFAAAPVIKSCSSSFLGLPSWYKYLEIDSDCNVSFEVTEDIPKVLLAIFEIILRLAGVAAVVMVMTGGFKYMISQGEPDKIKGAQATIVNALIGLAITMLSVVVVNLIGGIV